MDRRGRAAKARIELTQTEQAFDHLRASALDAIIKSTAGEVEKREHLYRTVQTIDAIRERLHQIVNDGEIDAYITETGNPHG